MLEVLDNLLSNAIRFAKSQVIVSIEIEEEVMGKYMYLYVEDDGKGFLESELHKAIGPYYSSEQKKNTLELDFIFVICSVIYTVERLVWQNRIDGNGAIISTSF